MDNVLATILQRVRIEYSYEEWSLYLPSIGCEIIFTLRYNPFIFSYEITHKQSGERYCPGESIDKLNLRRGIIISVDFGYFDVVFWKECLLLE